MIDFLHIIFRRKKPSLLENTIYMLCKTLKLSFCGAIFATNNKLEFLSNKFPWELREKMLKWRKKMQVENFTLTVIWSNLILQGKHSEDIIKALSFHVMKQRLITQHLLYL